MDNPFRPGAGQMPPHLAGRDEEKRRFQRLLKQHTILENVVLTGLRGVGKTVLLETFKPVAIAEGWLWAGTDLSESMSITDDHLAIRILTDLSMVTSSVVVTQQGRTTGFGSAPMQIKSNLDYSGLRAIYDKTPGLAADKLKRVLELVWDVIRQSGRRGLIFAYDEAQNLSDHAAKDQFPLSLMLDVFQSIQRKNIPFMLVLTGLPTLFPKLVEARTYAERMFDVIALGPLNEVDTYEAVEKAIVASKECPIRFNQESLQIVWQTSTGYPYFIQYICREVFDVWVQNDADGREFAPIPVDAIVRKLDNNFFAGRWARTTDRQRELLSAIATLDNCDGEFAVQEIVSASREHLERPFSPSHTNQMLVSLAEQGLIYKNRYGKYSFAVPLMGQFIRRQAAQSIEGGLF